MKVPASALSKSAFPINFPVRRNPMVHKKPRERQDSTVRRMVRRIRRVSPDACASEMVGSRSTEIEFVITDGNMMTAIAIPVKMP